VTLALSRRSVEFSKREARKHGSQYQRMIRRLLDAYTLLHLEAEQRQPARSRKSATTNGSRKSAEH
jgi:hypothetical protein